MAIYPEWVTADGGQAAPAGPAGTSADAGDPRADAAAHRPGRPGHQSLAWHDIDQGLIEGEPGRRVGQDVEDLLWRPSDRDLTSDG